MFLINDCSIGQKMILGWFTCFMQVEPPSPEYFDRGIGVDREKFKSFHHFVCFHYTESLFDSLSDEVTQTLKQAGIYEIKFVEVEQCLRAEAFLENDKELNYVQVLDVLRSFIKSGCGVAITALLIQKQSQVMELDYSLLLEEIDAFIDRLRLFFGQRSEEFLFAKLGRLFDLFIRLPDKNQKNVNTYLHRFKMCVLMSLGLLGAFNVKGKPLSEKKKIAYLERVMRRYIDLDILKNDTGDPCYERRSLFRGMVDIFLLEGERTNKLNFKLPHTVSPLVEYFIDVVSFVNTEAPLTEKTILQGNLPVGGKQEDSSEAVQVSFCISKELQDVISNTGKERFLSLRDTLKIVTSSLKKEV